MKHEYILYRIVNKSYVILKDCFSRGFVSCTLLSLQGLLSRTLLSHHHYYGTRFFLITRRKLLLLLLLLLFSRCYDDDGVKENLVKENLVRVEV